MELFAINLSVAALAVCLVHAGWLAICLATGRRRLAASSVLTASLLSLVLALAAGVSWAAADSFPLPRIDQLVVPVVLAAWLVLRFGWGKRLSGCLDPAHWQVCAAANLLLLAAAGWHFQSSTEDRLSSLDERRVLAMVPVDDAVLVTDQGRVFSVFHFDPQGKPYVDDSLPFTYLGDMSPQPAAADHMAPQQNTQPVRVNVAPVRVSLTDTASNCHGWVFTGGRYVVSEAAVEALLQDNGYELVALPRPGDVIVYRDDAGQIVHTGRVRQIHDGGEVWIESKRGPGGRYVHLPHDQCYSGTMVYYRTSRANHDAQIVLPPAVKDSRLATAAGFSIQLERS